MKQLTTFGGQKIALGDDEAENVKKMWSEDSSEPIELRNGSMINPKAIESISEVETKPYFRGSPMSRDMTKVFVGGEWKQFAGNSREIEMRPVFDSFEKIETIKITTGNNEQR